MSSLESCFVPIREKRDGRAMNRALSLLMALFGLLISAHGATATHTDPLTFRQIQKNGVNGVDGLAGTDFLTVSPDGKNVYATGYYDHAIAVFSRDANTGDLALVHVVRDGEDGVDGLAGASSVTVSPDGENVYATGSTDHALAVFSRDPDDDGALTFVEVQRLVATSNFLKGASSVTVSPDGRHVYATGPDLGAVLVYSRNQDTGALTFVEHHTGLSIGLEGVYSVVVSADGLNVYTVAGRFFSSPTRIVVFDRNQATGALTSQEILIPGENGVPGLFIPNIALSSDGQNLYASGVFDSTLTVFSRDANTGALTFTQILKNGVDGVVGLVFPRKPTVSPDGAHVYVPNSFGALAVFSRDADDGALTLAEILEDGVDGVDGLLGAGSVAVSADNRNVYVAAGGDSAIAVFRAGAPEVSGMRLAINRPFAAPGQSQPDLLVQLVNDSDTPVAALQFTLDLSQVTYATLGVEGEPLSPEDAAALIDASGAPEGFEVRGNLVADGDTLKVVIFSTTGAVIPPAAQPTTLFRLRYTAGQQLGVEDPISFAPGSLVSDEDAGQLFFDTQDGAILTGIRGDRNLDGQIDVRDVVLLIGAILGRNGQTLPEPGAVAFAIADVNGDQGINVGDAVCIVNIILRIVKPPAKVVSDPVTVALGDPVTLADGRLVIPVVTGGGVAGLQASFTFDPTRLQIGTPTLADGIAALIDSRIQDGQLRLVVVNLGGRSLPDGALVYLPVTSSGADATLTLTDATVSNVFAQVTPITFGATQASVRAAGLPTAFSLGGARPNPFNPSATIAYEAPLQAHITLAVYNVLGQEVVTLVNEVKTPGRYTVTWDGRNAGGLGVASGVYLYRMTSSTGYTDTKRMTLLK